MSKFEFKMGSTGLARMIAVAAVAFSLLFAATAAHATIPGETGSNFNLTASAAYVTLPDGGSVYAWGYGVTGSPIGMQLPGPTLIVTAGTTVRVTLTNQLPAAAGNVSIVFSGQKVTVDPLNPGVTGLLTQEATPGGGTVTYTFTASEPGTYLYHSGTRPDLQVEMGLFGALIVRPAGATFASCAYAHAATCFDREYLFVLSEVDPAIHRAVEAQASGPGPITVATEPYHSKYWMINGRSAPDTMKEPIDPLLPHQPYNIMPRMHPGERLLMRVVGAGREMHPYHFHGNHAQVLARDGRLILSATDPTKLAGPQLFTIASLPGGTVDAIYEWTGKDLGWDIYGDRAHTCNGLLWQPGQAPMPSAGYDPVTKEWCPDHGAHLPAQVPDPYVMTNGALYSGTPYMGSLAQLPPGQGGMNPNGGFTYMWHSHTEREMTNNDVFPGGMMTMLIIEPPGVQIMQ
ncbi:MAG: multicopper oxidase domain-containing protein [Terriglobales bacterium]